MAAGEDWTALPSDILGLIAERLGLIDLLRFRAVCKDWRSASSTASAEIEALQNHGPWFLSYGQNNSQCTLVTEYYRTYSITIPELDGATCIGSSQGWLLLFREGEGEGSMFFFCPLSRARIDLPVPGQFPRMEITHYAATFSYPPTSKDCVACIISNERKIELYVIHRGATAWTMYELEVQAFRNKILYAAYHNGLFYFFDNYKGNRSVCFSIENRRLSMIGVRSIDVAASAAENFIPIRFCTIHEENNMMNRFLFGLNDVFPRSICGTTVSCRGLEVMVPYYRLIEKVERPRPKGAWFQPRFHQIDQNQSW